VALRLMRHRWRPLNKASRDNRAQVSTAFTAIGRPMTYLLAQSCGRDEPLLELSGIVILREWPHPAADRVAAELILPMWAPARHHDARKRARRWRIGIRARTLP